MLRNDLGVNLDGPSDSSPVFPMLNLMKQSREAGPVSDPIRGGFGVYGIPQGDFGCLVFSEGAWPKGEYDLILDAVRVDSVKILVGGGLVGLNKVKVTGDTLIMAFYGMGWRTIELRPAGTTGKWRPEFLKAIEPFRILRFMDLLRTNNSISTEFVNRTRPDSLTYNQFGMSYEDIFDLANLTGKDIWINVPVGWTHADFISLATLAFAKLTNPLVQIYTEYSNEVWNAMFNQSARNFELAQTDTRIGTETNTFYRAWKRTAAQAADLGYTFMTTFSGRSNLVRPILCGQVGNEAVARKGLELLKSTNTLQWIWGLAGAPYFGNMRGFSDRDDLTVENFFGPYDFVDDKGVHRVGLNYYLDRAGSTAGDKARTMVADAKQYGLVPCLYEFGKDNGDYRRADGRTKSQEAKNAAALDPRMEPVIQKNLDLWLGGPGCYFTMASRYDRFCWGATNKLENLNAPIYRTLAGGNAMVNIDASLLEIGTGTRKPLTGSLDLSRDSTIEFTTDGPVIKLRLTCYRDGALISSKTESGKPYHLLGDNVPVKLSDGKYNLEAIAYDSNNMEVGRRMFEIVVGADEVTLLKQQIGTLERDLGTARGQLVDLQAQVRVALQRGDMLQAKIDKAKGDLT